jgi:ATP-dependent DNA helicase 2 subunit 1
LLLKSFRSVKDAVLFAIDVSSSMLKPRPSEDPKKPGEESPASAALKCAYHLMQQRIISNPHDMIGVLLYGTKSSKFYDEDGEGADLSYPHCYLFTDLDIPSAQQVKELRSLAEDEAVARGILIPSEEGVSMANVLFCANQIFTSKAPNFLSRRLFIVTDEDNPHGNNKTLRSAATVRARDLYDLGVTIELFPISRPDHEFDTSKFYDVRLQSYLELWRQKLTRRRTSFTKLYPVMERRRHISSPIQTLRLPKVTEFHYSTLSYQASTPDRYPGDHSSPMSLWN